MPDIYTKHPDVVRSLLEAGGFKCGAESRILKPRDPEWTCLVDGEKFYGDIYIHHINELKEGKKEMTLPASGSLLILLLLPMILFLFIRRIKSRDA